MTHLDRLKSAVQDSAFDALMLTSDKNRFYATGFPSSAGVALITPTQAYFMTDARYIEAAEAALGSDGTLLVDRDNPYSLHLNTLISDCGIKTLGFEDETMTVAAYKGWQEKVTAELAPAQSVIAGLRAVKTRDDLDAMIAAQRIAEKAFTQILPIISTDITEKELAAELVCRMLQSGADDKSFDPIVVSGARSSMPHGVPTAGKIEKGFLTIDFGVRKNGWCSDTTRTLCVGRPTAEMTRVYDTVVSAQTAGIEAVHTGATGSQIDAAARQVIEKAGYGAYFTHGFGHGLGLDVHEAPSASSIGREPIPEGAVISAEPGIYIPGKFGVRVEDVLYVTMPGSENITRLSKTLTVL